MNRRELLAGAAAFSLVRATAHSQPGPNPPLARGHSRLKTFDYRGVTLLPSRLADQVHATRELYFNLSNDDILKGFRREAGLPAPGNDLKGWSRKNSSATFGQWISGMARLSCATDDAALRQKAITLVEEWGKTVGPDGNCRMATYAWEKTCCGLVDLALYADYPQALVLLARITDWASRSFDRSRSPATPMDRDGRRPHGTLEWYTLPENSYRAYLASGNPAFRDFGDLWQYTSYWNQFETSSRPPGAAFLHSYSHINTFCGVAMAYAVTGDPRWLRILRNAYIYATQVQAYASGGYGPGEWSVPADGTLGRALEWRSDTAEVPCGSWAGFKLSKYLLTYTGEAHYGEWIETLLYNGISATLPVQPDGTAFYYADYRLGTATKLYYWDQWPCCSGTYIQTVADYHDVIYLHDDDDLYVNLFVPSQLAWNRHGQTVTIRQETTFPQEGSVNFNVTTNKPTAFAIKLRVPAWARGFQLSVGGAAVPVAARPGEWAEVRRTWRPGDTLILTLDMPLYIVPVDAEHPRRAAVKYGPVLLAQDAEFTHPLGLGPTEDVSTRLTRVEPDLVFKVNDPVQHEQDTGRFRPLYAVKERAPYRVYFDLDAPRFL